MPKGIYPRGLHAKKVGIGPPPEMRKALLASFMTGNMEKYGDAMAALREWLKANPRKKDETIYSDAHSSHALRLHGRSGRVDRSSDHGRLHEDRERSLDLP